MLPVIALVGRPNVGKSTLFNRLTRTRDALVADMPGLTRDRRYGRGRVGARAFLVVDTGGLSGEAEGIDALMAEQSWRAVEEADAVVFLVDAREGAAPADADIAARLRRAGKPVHLVVNKAEGLDPAMAGAEFHALGVGEPAAISAAHGDHVAEVMEAVLDTAPAAGAGEAVLPEGVRIAVLGRPNVGKSTLVNRLVGEERVLAYDQPGTTRDSVLVPFERDGVRYTLIDTAGVRRRSRVSEAVEKFSVIKALQALEAANVAVLVLDARDGVTDQDATLAGYVVERGRALVVAVNKWDGLSTEQREQARRLLDIKLPFITFAETYFISALHGTGVGELLDAVGRAYAAATATLETPRLTRILEAATTAHPPPLVRGRRVKLRYAHQGGQNPPVIVIHGNQTERLPDSYRRYLSNQFREQLGLHGTPLRLEFRTGRNPYEGRRNKLTPRQERKRKRLVRHIKSR